MLVTNLIILNINTFILQGGGENLPELSVIVHMLSKIDGITNNSYILSTLDIPSFYEIRKMIEVDHINFRHFHSNLHLFNVYLLRLFSLSLRGKFLFDRYDQYQTFLFEKFSSSNNNSFSSYVDNSLDSFYQVNWRYDQKDMIFLENEIETIKSNISFYRKVINEKNLNVDNFSTVLPDGNSPFITVGSMEGLDRALTIATSTIL
jgi:hypothetical protein